MTLDCYTSLELLSLALEGRFTFGFFNEHVMQFIAWNGNEFWWVRVGDSSHWCPAFNGDPS